METSNDFYPLMISHHKEVLKFYLPILINGINLPEHEDIINLEKYILYNSMTYNHLPSVKYRFLDKYNDRLPCHAPMSQRERVKIQLTFLLIELDNVSQLKQELLANYINDNSSKLIEPIIAYLNSFLNFSYRKTLGKSNLKKEQDK